MFTTLASRFYRKITNGILFAVILSLALLALPKGVSAAVPSFEVTAVRADELVTVRTKDFPSNVKFTVRMDKAGNSAVDGIVVGEINSGLGGSFEASFRIPAELRGVQTLAIRFEGEQGYYSFNWFNNRTQGSTTVPSTGSPVSIPNTGGEKPYLEIVAVKKNTAITVEAFNLPTNTSFRVRVGPFYTFSRDYVVVTNVNSGSTGAIRFTIELPASVKDVEMITVRMDGSGRYAYNAFKNVDKGTVSTIPVTGGPTATPRLCEVISVTPSAAQLARADVDVVWTVKNTGTTTWDKSAIDYGYVSGTKMHKYNDRYDMVQTVKPGETVKIVVDVLAPSQAGYYTTNWALLQGSTNLCTLTYNLRVK